MIALVPLLIMSACADEGESVSTEGFMAVTGADVILATRAAGTATVTIDEHASVADPGTDHGTSGLEEEDQRFEGQFDFEGNRAVIRWEFPPLDLDLGDDVPEAQTGPTRVEARLIEDVAYVRDGSWLCPLCGFDDDEPLPSDKWITVPLPAGDNAFDFSLDAFHGRLGWLELVQDSVSPIRIDTVKGVRVGVYESRISAKAAQTAAASSKATDVVDPPQFQGDEVTIKFAIDEKQRLRSFVVDYEMDDRARSITARVGNFGKSLHIEKPAEDEIFVE